MDISDSSNSSNSSDSTVAPSSNFSSSSDTSSMSESPESPSDDLFFDAITDLNVIETTRYLVPRVRVPKHYSLATDLLPKYDDERFRRTVRMSRDQFSHLCNLIQDHEVFMFNHYPVEVQLVFVLNRFGTFGNSASVMSLARDFGIGDGGIVNIFTKRVIKALLSLEKQIIKWPSVEERQALARYMSSKIIPQCIGFVDGTHIALEAAPKDDPISYYNRKEFYSLNLQLITDPFRRICAYHIGQPGKVHDSKVYSLTAMAKSPHLYFEGDQFIIGDAAYALTSTLITPFRKTRGFTEQHEKLNHYISKQRMTVEHVNGNLKSWFASLRGLRMIIDRKQGHQYACEWTVACLIPHNYLLNEDPWEDDFPENDEVQAAGQDDVVLDEAVDTLGQTKRAALLEYIMSHFTEQGK